MARCWPRTGVFNAYDTSHGPDGAWAGAQAPPTANGIDRAEIIAFPSSLPAMPSAWGITRPQLGHVRWIAGDPDVIGTNVTRCEYAVYGGTGEEIGIPPRNLATIGDDVWQSWEVYIPPGTVFNTGFNHLMQWHGRDGVITVGPIISLSINRAVTPNQFQSWVWGGATNAARVNSNFNFAPYKSGWSRFLYHIIWGATLSTGLIEVWVDDFSGNPLVSHAGANCFAAAAYDDGMYIKQGIYSGRRSSSIELWFGGHRLASTRNEVVGTGGGVIGLAASAATDTFTFTSHGFVAGNQVQFTANAGAVLPAPILLATPYYVVNVSANTFQVSNSYQGAAIDLTTNSSGAIFASLYAPPPPPPPTDPDVFGRNLVGGATLTTSATPGRARTSKYALTQRKKIPAMNLYLSGEALGSGAGFFTPGIYADDAGGARPGSLVHQFEEIVLLSNDPPGFYRAETISPPTLDPGQYWLAFEVGGTFSGLYFHETVNGALVYVTDPNAYGVLPNPWPITGNLTDAKALVIYAELADPDVTGGLPKSATLIDQFNTLDTTRWEVIQ